MKEIEQRIIEKQDELIEFLDNLVGVQPPLAKSEWDERLRHFNELDALRAEQGEKGETARVGRDEWIRFEDKLPLEGQEIMLTWPSGNYHPEYRKVTKDMLKGDLSLLRWIPIPKY
jgi:hypothetical protein